MTELLERQRELDMFDRARASALKGNGGVVLVEGAAGVGKSALLGELAAGARADGMRVLTSTGGELERDFPFGVVRQLLEPELLAATTARRDDLLSGAAAAAGPALGFGTARAPSAPDAGFASLHGLYWLVAALAEEQPLLMVLDDAHWADPSSLRFADFVARRVSDLSVLLAVGMRPREPGAEHALLAGLAESDASTVVRPQPLSATATRDLVASQMGADQSADATQAAHQATGGNPLLLRELVRSVGEDGPLSAEAVHDAVPSSVSRSVERRLARLPEHVRAVAVALAVLGDRRDTRLLAAVTDQDEPAVLDSLDALRGPQLVTGDPPEFSHPLLREAVADSVPTGERIRLHGRAAEALRTQPHARNQLVMHLLAAPPLGEAWAAQELRAAAGQAMAEGATDAAVTRLRRALEEIEDPDPELLLELGMAESSAGDPAAGERLAEAERAGDPKVTARAAVAQIALTSLAAAPEVTAHIGSLESAMERLDQEADEDLLQELTGVLLIALARDTSMSARRLQIMDDAGEAAGYSTLGLRASEELNREATTARVKELAVASLAGHPLRVPHQIPGGGQTAAFSLASIDEPELSDQALRESEQTARRAGSRFYSAITAATRGEWNLLYGSLSSAEHSARHAFELLEEMGGAGLGSVIRSTAAIATTRQGLLDEADELLAPLDVHDRDWTTSLVLMARAELRLTQGRADDALADAETAASIWSAFGWRQFVRGNPVALRATILAAAGRREDAQALAQDEVEFTRRTGRVTAEAAALIALGRAQDGSGALATLEAAHSAAKRSPVPIVRAEATVEYGAALRRAGRRADAREMLQAGGEIAARIGATLLGDRAREELSVAGGRRRDPFSSGVDSLTPSERRVAEHAARGLTNREIAETLFVTQKTVEVHLGKTYAKLEIRSRNQLAAALAGSEPAGAAS